MAKGADKGEAFDGQQADEVDPQQNRADPDAPQKVRVELAPWVVLLGSGVIGFGSLIALAIVASVRGSEALATIALALAIVSFGIQILVFIVQGRFSILQMVRTEQLYRETSGLLVEVRTAARSTQDFIGNQFTDLLNAFVRAGEKTAEETKMDPNEFSRLLMQNIRQTSSVPSESAPGGSATEARGGPGEPASQSETPPRRVVRRPPPLSEVAKERLAELDQMPPEDRGRKELEELGALSYPARDRLKNYAEDEVRSLRRRTLVGMTGSADSFDRELVGLGVVSEFRTTAADGVRTIWRLTDKGKKIVPLFTAPGEVPNYVNEFLTEPPRPASEDDIPF